MARNFSLPYQIPPVALLPPAADAAGRTSGYRNIRSVDKAYIVVHLNQGNAAVVTLTPLQGQDVSGTGSKGLSAAVPIWLMEPTSTTDALVAQTAGTSFTTDATVADKIVIFEITPEACMDIPNAFRSLAVSTSASNAANITEAKLWLVTDYAQATPPTTYSN
jgi:hypothetical protein